MAHKGHVISFLLSSSGMIIKQHVFIIRNIPKGETSSVNISWDPDNKNLKMKYLKYLYKFKEIWFK